MIRGGSNDIKKYLSVIFITIVLFLTPIIFTQSTFADKDENIRFNEIMYNPQGSDSGHEWIEIYNEKDASVDITGWRLYENGVNHNLNEYQGGMIILAEGYAVIADNADTFLLDYPDYMGVLIDTAFSLSNSGEYLAIKNSDLEIIDELTYVPQSGADDTGMSLEFVDGDWFVSMEYGGTPGEPNSITKSMTVSKTAWDGDSWEEEIFADIYDTIRFNITITNSGTDPYVLYDIEITDILPDGLEYANDAMLNGNPREPDIIEGNFVYWYIPHSELIVHKGESIYIEFDVEVSGIGIFENTGGVQSKYCDPDIEYVYDEDTATVISSGDQMIRIEKFVKWDDLDYQKEITVEKDTLVNFKIEVYNFALETITTNIRDELSEGLVYEDNAMVNGEPFEPEISGNCYYWNLSDVEPGEQIIITFDAMVEGFGENINLANVTAIISDEDVHYDEDYATVLVKQISFDKTVWDSNSMDWVKEITVEPEDILRFNLTLTYHAESVLIDITILDTLPENLEYANNATINESGYEGQDIWWDIPALVPDESISIEFDAVVTEAINSTNIATVAAFECGNQEDVFQSSNVSIVVVELLHADAGGPYISYLNQPVEITGDAWGGVPEYNYSWDVTGDGVYGDLYGKTVEFVPIHTGENPIRLKVTDEEMSIAYDNTTLYVTDQELEVFTNGPYEGLQGETIEISGYAIGGFPPYSFSWDLDNDGEFDDATGDTISHSWDENGTYAIGIKVIDNMSSEDTNYTTVTIREYYNSPPDKPSNPSPPNNSPNQSINLMLKVFVKDPNNDTMTVSFYNAADNSLIGTKEDVSSNTNTSIGWEDLDYGTTYEWYANASDGDLTNTSDTWSFTTKKDPNKPPTIDILKPAEKYVYFRNIKLFAWKMTFIIGKIDIEVNVTDNKEVQKVEFYIDGFLEHTATNATDNNTYKWTLNKIMFFGHIIKIKAYDNDGNVAEDSRMIFVINFRLSIT